MKTIDPKQLETQVFQQILSGAVVPRPIALASTVDLEGNVNLSPFSFFNCFSSNPPILVFSPARRVRNNTTKHTLENVLETKEVVINIVNYQMVEQTSLSSVEFDQGVDEFKKSGLTPVVSERIKPPRVKESPVAFECRVNEVKALGEEGGAGHLVICEVLLVHIDESVLDDDNRISPFKLDAVARLGGDWYCRTNAQSLFEVPKPGTKSAVGFEALPKSVLQSDILTANNLARLASVEVIPVLTDEEQQSLFNVLDDCINEEGTVSTHLVHEKIKHYIDNANVEMAWKLLLAVEFFNKK